MSEPVLGFPNQLTILRMICAPIFVALTLDGNLGAAVGVFMFAAVTDLLDGLVARFYKQKTALGAILDPVADKILMGSAFVALSFADTVAVRLPKWLTIMVLSRDAIILISAIAITLVHGRRPFLPSRLGKASTALQMFCAALAFAANLTPAVPGSLLRGVSVATAVVTVVSGLHYLYRVSSRRHAERAES